MPLIVAGRIVPLDDKTDPDAIFAGRVFIDDSGIVERVTAGNAAAPAGFATATEVNAGDAFVLPGLIDLHNHIGYNTLPLWAEDTQKVAYAHHNSWTRAKSYQSQITWPSKTLADSVPEALLAHVQLRALAGGTTAIQGWPTANREHVQVLRNIDDETAGKNDHNLIYTSVLTKKPLELAKTAQAQKQGAGFIYHCGEGQAGSLVEREFVDAANAGCLGKTFIGIHCNALTNADWLRWDKSEAGAVAWSPFSNLWLYGSTTDVVAARKQGVAICLGSDWGPSGTKNVQGEVKVAKLASAKLGFGLSDRELVAMLTTNPGDVLTRCWQKTVGRLVPGAFADITVLRASGTKSVWTQIVESTERDVMLVVAMGVPRYGDAGLMEAAGKAQAAKITVAGKPRRFSIPNPAKPNQDWSWKDITGQLEAVRKDPEAAIKHAEARMRAYAGRMDAPDAPLILALDMPTGGTAFAGSLADHAHEVVIPPLSSLVHDKKFFQDIKGRGFHGGLLDGLQGFYQ